MPQSLDTQFGMLGRLEVYKCHCQRAVEVVTSVNDLLWDVTTFNALCQFSFLQECIKILKREAMGQFFKHDCMCHRATKVRKENCCQLRANVTAGKGNKTKPKQKQKREQETETKGTNKQQKNRQQTQAKEHKGNTRQAEEDEESQTTRKTKRKQESQKGREEKQTKTKRTQQEKQGRKAKQGKKEKQQKQEERRNKKHEKQKVKKAGQSVTKALPPASLGSANNATNVPCVRLRTHVHAQQSPGQT